MKPLYLLTVFSIGLVFLSGCASTSFTSVQQDTASNKPVCHDKKCKNPMRVSFYNNHPNMPYTIIGEESISKFNKGGIKRQEAHLRDSMRELAAAMGGDAVIDIKRDSKSISGTVVAFQKDEAAVKES